jgi:hypothetical protein
VDAPDWDEEAIEEAEYRARAIEPFDPDAASDMRAMAATARAKLTGQPIASTMREPYDPMRIYARMSKYYGWSHQDMEQMHFVTFFGYVREANEMSEEEKAEYERAKRGQQTSTTPEQALGMFPVAERYQGETVAI